MNLADYQGIWVYIEIKDGKVAPVSLELLGAGRKLADKRGTELGGVLIGSGIKDSLRRCSLMGPTLSTSMTIRFLPITAQNRICAHCFTVAKSISRKCCYTERRRQEKI